jgi:hypothetical protein
VGEKWSRRWFIHRSSFVRCLLPAGAAAAAIGSEARAKRKARRRETMRARDPIIGLRLSRLKILSRSVPVQ